MIRNIALQNNTTRNVGILNIMLPYAATRLITLTTRYDTQIIRNTAQWNRTVRINTVRYSQLHHGTICNDKKHHVTTQHNTVRYGATCHATPSCWLFCRFRSITIRGNKLWLFHNFFIRHDILMTSNICHQSKSCQLVGCN